MSAAKKLEEWMEQQGNPEYGANMWWKIKFLKGVLTSNGCYVLQCMF